MIDQNTIISMLNEVVPQMQKSNNPETTLLKYAKEKNLPPSILERMTHMFNSLKTNCYMDHAESMEKRGSQFSLIDAPTLLSKYTEFAGDNVGKDFKDSVSNINDFWDIKSPKTSISFKIASETIKEAKLSDLFDKSDSEIKYDAFIDSVFEDELNKVASENINALDQQKSEDIFVRNFDHQKTLENLEEYITTETYKRASIVKEVRNMLRDDESLFDKFASFEEDAILLDEDVKNSMSSFVNELGYAGNSYYKENIKRASETPKKHLIKDIHPITQKLIDYSNSSKCIKLASDYIKLADLQFRGRLPGDKDPDPEEERAKAIMMSRLVPDEAHPRYIPPSVKNYTQDMFDSLELGTNNEEVTLPTFDDDKEDSNEVVEMPDTSEAETVELPTDNQTTEQQQNKDQKDSFDKDVETASKKEKESKNKPNKDNGGNNKQPPKPPFNNDSSSNSSSKSNKGKGKGKGKGEGAGYGKAIVGGLDKILDQSGKALNDIGSINKSLWDIANKATQKTHSKKQDSIQDFFNKTSDLLFQKMMMTDPILSKITDPTTIEDIKDAYKTYRIQYPEIAFQPSLLKSVLRGAAQVGGEDISALKDLTSARKSIAEAKKIEHDLKNLNIF